MSQVMREWLVVILLGVAYVWVSLAADRHGAYLPVVMQPTAASAPTPTLEMSATWWVSPVGTPVAGRSDG